MTEPITKQISLSATAPGSSSTMGPEYDTSTRASSSNTDKSPRRGISPSHFDTPRNHHHHHSPPADRANIDEPDYRNRPKQNFKIKDLVELKTTKVRYKVTDHVWNDVREGWDYKLKHASSGTPYEYDVRETDIRKARA